MSFVEDRSVLSLTTPPPDREIRYGDDPLHVADVWNSRPAVGGALVVLIHGGFWRPAFDRKHLGPLANAIADAGFTVASIEYRRVPGEPDLTASDVVMACRTVPGLLGAQRAVAIGHSAGGHLALLSAAIANAQLSVIALAPAASLTMAESLGLGGGAASAFLGVPASARRDLDPVELPSPSEPVTIIHGLADEIVPVSLADRYVATHAATKLIKLPDLGHFAMIDPRTDAWPAIADELRRMTF